MAGYLRRWAPGRLAGVIAYVLWAAVAPTPSHGEVWTTYQHDAQHRGGSSSSIEPRALSYSWSAPSGFRRGVIVGNRVFSTRTVGEAAAFDLDTGKMEWNYTEGINRASAPSYAEGWLIFAAETSEGDQLIVLDADTGDVIYKVNMTISVSTFGSMPTVDRNPQTGALVAYLATHNQVEAIELGESGGTSLWTGTGSFGGYSFPTVAGESLILASPGQYYAFDIHTGQRNHFQNGNISGGGGNTAAYDESRNQLYILEYFETSDAFLSAYRVIDNNNITLLWQEEGLDIWAGNAAALDSEGYIYSIGGGTLAVRNPETGDVMDSVVGSFANGMAPILSDEYIWTFSNSETNVYDRASLKWVTSLPGTRGNSNTPWKSIGALTDTHFVMDNQQGSGGFDVFVATSCQSDDNCDDENSCTDDFCDPKDPNADEFGCTHSPTDCDDDDACTADSCDPDTGCTHEDIECPEGQVCDPASGECVEDQNPCECVNGRVTICHIPQGNRANAHTITVGCAAGDRHLAHGDICGPCEDGDG